MRTITRFLVALTLLLPVPAAAQISAPFRIENQGSLLPLAYTGNFTGAGVTCSYSASPLRINCAIPGAGGGGTNVSAPITGDGSVATPIGLGTTGPGAGTIGGAPNFIQSVTLDAYGRVTAAVAASVSSGGGYIYGDGTDGAAAFDGTTTPAGTVKNSPTSYNIVRDVFYTTCSFSAGVSVFENGYKVFCSVSATFAATSSLQMNGNNATNGVAGANLVGATLCGGSGNNCGVIGGAGGTNGGNGATSTGQTAAGFGGQGGAGGAAGTGGGAGNAGTVTGPTNTTTQSVHDCEMAHFGYLWNATSTVWVNVKGGSGGGGGGSTAAGSVGGGGGSGGGVVWLASPIITNVTNGIEALGGNGANASGSGTGGGGGGGGGGLIILFYNSGQLSGHTPTAATDAAGGSPGSGLSTGHIGIAGSNGSAPILCAN